MIRTRIYKKKNDSHVVLDVPGEEPREFFVFGSQVKEVDTCYQDGRSVCYYLQHEGVPLHCLPEELIGIIRREYRKARSKEKGPSY